MPVVPVPQNGSSTMPPGLQPGLDAARRQVDRVGGEVRAPVGAGRDGPDVAGVAPVAGARRAAASCRTVGRR